LNASGPVSADTRARVLEAAGALSYQISDLGRALKSKRSRTIGCLVPSLVNPVFADAVQAAQAVCEAAGYHLLLVCSEYEAQREAEAVQMLLQKSVEGVVLTVSDAADSAALSLLQDHDIPHCLMFNTNTNTARSPAFFVDNAGASRQVAALFAAQGHRKTAFLALHFAASDRSRQRFEGFCTGCAANGLPVPQLFEIDETTPAYVDEIEALLLAHPDVTALHASNDLLALSTYKAARRLGRSVPEDLSVVGFDGIAVGELVEPPLTTVVTDAKAMGRGAAQAVVDALGQASPVTAPRMALPFEIRFGGSLGPVDRDGEDAATSAPPLCHPKQTAKTNQEHQL